MYTCCFPSNIYRFVSGFRPEAQKHLLVLCLHWIRPENEVWHRLNTVRGFPEILSRVGVEVRGDENLCCVVRNNPVRITEVFFRELVPGRLVADVEVLHRPT